MTPLTSRLGTTQTLAGRVILGGQGQASPAPPSAVLDTTRGLPYIAHLYDHLMNFKRLLGPLLNRPKLKYTLNAGHHPIEVEIDNKDPNIVVGDLLFLSEQGGDGSIVYGGIIEDFTDEVSDSAYYRLQISPFQVELADTGVDQDYPTAVDLAVMIRDAVNQTPHLSVTPQSVPNTGFTAAYNFSLTNALDVIETCKTIGGVNFAWFVDHRGVVWFQQTNLNRAVYTVKRGMNYDVRVFSSPLGKLKNHITVVGGIPAFKSAPITSVRFNNTSIATYGKRKLTPVPHYPNCKDQGTLDKIAGVYLVALNRKLTTVTLELPNWGTRPLMGVPGGPTIRYFEPGINPLPESSGGNSNYSPNYVILDVEVDGPNVKITCGDIPLSEADVKHELARLFARKLNVAITDPSLPTNQDAVISGSLTTTDIGNGFRAVLDSQSLRIYNGSNVDYGAPSGVGVSFESGALGAGPWPSTFIGGTVTIRSSLNGPYLQLDSSTTPLITVNDGSRDRIQIGQLGAYTDINGVVSPAGYSARVIDVNGMVIWDAVGVPAAMAGVIGYAQNLTAYTTSSTSVVTMTSMSVTFTLARDAHLVTTGHSQARITGAGGNLAYVGMYLDGVTYDDRYVFDLRNGGITRCAGSHHVSGTGVGGRVTAGTHTIDMRVHVDNAGMTFTNDQSYFEIHQFGG